MALQVGDKAPVFTALNQDGKEVTLSEIVAKADSTVLYFYPKDNTSACTAQACNLRDNMADLTSAGYQVVGVSPDDIKSHQKFITKQNLNFQLIADTDTKIAQMYGVWQEKQMYGRKYMGVVRTTFIINREGVITNIINQIKTSDHAAQILSGKMA